MYVVCARQRIDNHLLGIVHELIILLEVKSSTRPVRTEPTAGSFRVLLQERVGFCRGNAAYLYFVAVRVLSRLGA